MLGAVDAHDRERMTVSDVMEDAPDLPVLDASQEARSAIEVLAQPGSRALVREENSIVGIVTSGDLARAFQIGLGRSDSKGRAGPFAWTVVIASMAVVVGALYYPPVLIQEPGPTLDVVEDIKIEGLEVTDVNGKYLLTSVSIEERNFWGTILASFDPDTDLVRIETFYPEGIDPTEVDRRSRGEFNDSRMSAAVAAAEALGLEVVIKGTGARVVDVVDETPASGILEADDVIVAVDGAPIRLVTELQAVVRGSPPGTTFSMTVERQGTLQSIEVTSEEIDTDGVPITAIGVLIETRDEDIQLPFEISFTDRDIGGPSAGLVYALAIADLLDEADLANGRSIAATGTIDLNGQVGRVGGLEQKAIGAKDGKAEIFLLPSQDEDSGKIDGLIVIGVESLIEALEALRGR
jgi:PDZ domain-containing protein